MRKFLLLHIFVCSFFISVGQEIIKKVKKDPSYLKFLPSNINPNKLNSSDIPSEQVLKQMGLSDREIQEALQFKYRKGRYTLENIKKDTTSISKFYLNFAGDTIDQDSVLLPKAKIFGQDIFRINKLNYYQKALDAKAPKNYKIGPGDEISISIWGYNDFSETLEVDDRGYIHPSSYGRIYVKGLTFKNMREVLKNKFSNFLDMKNSEIDVTLSYSRVITVNIVGEVYYPGSYTIPAINTAFNALIAAKGPSQIGTVRNIYIKRDGETIDSLDIYKFLFSPLKDQDIYLQDGDYIFVPPAKHIIEVQGAVNRPYTYEAKTKESISEIIAYAGGLSPNAFADIITLKRTYNDALKIHDVYKDDISSTTVQTGDIIVVNKKSNIISNLVTVTGNIGVEGDYEFKKGEKLLDLLKKAQCINKNTFLNKVYVIRLNDDRTKSHLNINLQNIINDPSDKDNILLREYDVIRVLSNKDFDDFFSVSVLGAVRHPSEFDYGEGMSLQDLLLQAGGLKQEAEGSRVEISRIMNYDISSNKLIPKRALIKTIPIGDNLILSQEAENFILQPFDQVFVRTNPEFEPPINVIILGEIKYPGQYSVLRKNEKISSLIKRAGGLTNYSFLDGAQMYRRFSKNINNDDLIRIPEQLLDSILHDPKLRAIYKRNILQQERQRFNTDKLFNSNTEYIYDVVYLDLEKALNSMSSKHNLVLHEGDSIIIPKTMDIVHITGDLNNLEGNSISAPYFKRKRANYYVNNFAGGFSQNTNKAATVVVYPNGVAKKTRNFGLFVMSPRIKKGSTIKVFPKEREIQEEKKKTDWNAAIESAMIKATAILTLWLLIDKTQD